MPTSPSTSTRFPYPRVAPVRRAVAVADQIALGRRVYRMTPARLRRPEPAMRAGLLGASAWFALFFGVLARITLNRTDATLVQQVISVGGFALAAMAGIIGFGLVWTRRYRFGGYALGGAVVVGQAVTLVAVA